MMLYNPQEDTLTQTEKNDSNTYLQYDDIVIEHSLGAGSRVYKIKNASRHIKQSVLDKMVDDNEYLVRVDIRALSPWEDNSESENWKIQAYVLQLVEKTYVVSEWEEV